MHDWRVYDYRRYVRLTCDRRGQETGWKLHHGFIMRVRLLEMDGLGTDTDILYVGDAYRLVRDINAIEHSLSIGKN